MRSMTMICLCLVTASAMAEITPPDTLNIYGGPGTLEGKFETAGGAPDTQGWTTEDDSGLNSTEHWSVSTKGAANLDPDPDNHAWWCGQEIPACAPADSAWGYGNNWNTALGWSRDADPTRDATVTVTGTINLDAEAGYDILYVEAWTSTGRIILATLDGFHSAYDLDETVVLPAGSLLDDRVHLRLHFSSDGAFSDEDCMRPGAGALQVDNLQVTVQQDALPDYVSPVETCEPGSALQWEPVVIPYATGDYAKLWTGLGDLDPDVDNPTPQWAFINDGLGEPGYEASPCAVNCYAGDYSIYYGPMRIANSIISPPIALPENWTGELFLTFGSYQHGVQMNIVGVAWAMMYTDDPAGQDDWSLAWGYRAVVETEGLYYRSGFPVPYQIVPTGSRFVRIRLQARFFGANTWGTRDTPAPYVDNVRLQLIHEGISAVPPVRAGFSADAAPNPFNPVVTISWYLPRDGNLALRIYDASGRLVRTLRTGPAAPGPGETVWQGRDEQGRAVPTGVYFCRLESAEESRTLKVTLLK